MMSDAVGFLREGLEELWLHYDPLPSGDGAWHRVGINGILPAPNKGERPPRNKVGVTGGR
jgi:hypothetical protein